MPVHQCPRCELRFRGEAEVKAHLVADHAVDPEELEQRYGLRPPPPPHRRAPQTQGPEHRDPRPGDR